MYSEIASLALRLKSMEKWLGADIFYKIDIEPDFDWDDIWSYENRDEFEDHYERHHTKVGAKDWNDYAKKSNELYKKAAKEKLPTVKTKDGYIKIYDPKTKQFGTYNPEGKTETFYKANNQKYFEREIEKVVGRGGTIINPLPVKIPNEPITGESPSSGGFGGGGSGLDPFGRPEHIKPTDSLPEE